MKYLLDTNVIKELGKKPPHLNVKAWLATVDDSDLAISAISLREIYKGIEKLRQTKPDVAASLDGGTAAIVAAFEGRVIAIDADVAKAWGGFVAKSDKHVDDKGIAACAAVHGLIVVTRNIADFAGTGAMVLDPFKPAPQPVIA